MVSVDSMPLLQLGHSHLRDLEVCPRKFWLRHVAQVAWPAAPMPAAVEEALALGQLFHLTMQRHFEGIEPLEPPPAVADWWGAWQAQPIPLPAGRRLPEIALSLRLEGIRLAARYDLLVLADDYSALIVDFKTGRQPQPVNVLAGSMQARVYPFVLAEGGAQLTGGRPIRPDKITLVFWQASDPGHPIRLAYSDRMHAANRGLLEELTRQVASLEPGIVPPLLHDLTICARCALRSYCWPGLELDASADWDEPQPEAELRQDDLGAEL